MLPFGAQQTGQTVALLLRPPARKQPVQGGTVAQLIAPATAKMPDHVAHRCLGAGGGVTLAQKADNLSVRVGQGQTFRLGQRTRKGL